MGSIDTVLPVKKNQVKFTTIPQVEKTRTTTKHTATKTKNILISTPTPTTTLKKNYTGSGTEQNTRPI